MKIGDLYIINRPLYSMKHFGIMLENEIVIITGFNNSYVIIYNIGRMETIKVAAVYLTKL